MGAEYAKTLLHLGYGPAQVAVLGRSEERTGAFAERFGGMEPLVAATGDERLPTFDAAILAVPPHQMPNVFGMVLAGGTRRLLLEKPGGMSAATVEQLARDAETVGAAAFAAYNRRFFGGVDQIRRLIAEDGGVLSVVFDFSELEHRVVTDPVIRSWSDSPLERWGLINPPHILDLFIHLAGWPTEAEHRRSGSLPWHPSGAVFAGSGRTERGALFAYASTWTGAGRWGIEIATPANKFTLRPLEAPKVQAITGFAQSDLAFAPEPEGLKPGFFGLVSAFLGLPGGDPAHLCPLTDGARLLGFAEEIFGYEADGAKF